MSWAPSSRRERAPYQGPHWHTVEVVSRIPGERYPMRRSVEGSSTTTVAWLRALADEIESRENQ
jgi:hypothetical protein